jgi:hypothetical protein
VGAGRIKYFIAFKEFLCLVYGGVPYDEALPFSVLSSKLITFYRRIMVFFILLKEQELRFP